MDSGCAGFFALLSSGNLHSISVFLLRDCFPAHALRTIQNLSIFCPINVWRIVWVPEVEIFWFNTHKKIFPVVYVSIIPNDLYVKCINLAKFEFHFDLLFLCDECLRSSIFKLYTCLYILYHYKMYLWLKIFEIKFNTHFIMIVNVHSCLMANYDM